jgi:hypothetical protein
MVYYSYLAWLFTFQIAMTLALNPISPNFTDDDKFENQVGRNILDVKKEEIFLVHENINADQEPKGKTLDYLFKLLKTDPDFPAVRSANSSLAMQRIITKVLFLASQIVINIFFLNEIENLNLYLYVIVLGGQVGVFYHLYRSYSMWSQDCIE